MLLQDDCVSPFDIIIALPVSLSLLEDLVNNILIPIQTSYIEGVCTALCYPFDKFRQASQACWGIATRYLHTLSVTLTMV